MAQNVAFQYGMRFGIASGLFGLVYGVLGYLLGTSFFTNWWLGLIVLAISVGICVFGVFQLRRRFYSADSGFSFKTGFTTYFYAGGVSLLIGVMFNLLLFNVIDPDFSTEVQDAMIDMSISFMERMGAPENVIEESVDKMLETNRFSIGNQLRSIPSGLLLHALFGLIVALITRRKPSFI
jgi:hypothetical protein